MDTQATFPVRAVDAAAHHSRRLGVAIGTVVIGIAAATLLSSSGGRAPAAQDPAPGAPPAQVALATSGGASNAPTAVLSTRVSARHRSAVGVMLPDDHDLIVAPSIPVAGKAFGGPHGPRVRSVHVELWIGGRLVAGTDLEVYSGRFAGVLAFAAPVDRAEAELRFSDPGNPSRPATVRSISIQLPASATR